MAAPVTDLAALNAHLASLPPPGAGLVRVYRGQPVHYPKMLASGFRPGATEWERLWGFALKPFAENLIGRKISDSVLEYISYTANWFKAVAQHYGPGSRLLDVTKSIEVALWFALHQAHSNVAAQFAISQEDVEFPVFCPTLHFSPSKDGAGWIYVLDAPAWDGTRLPAHGELVDLGAGPELIAGSPPGAAAGRMPDRGGREDRRGRPLGIMGLRAHSGGASVLRRAAARPRSGAPVSSAGG